MESTEIRQILYGIIQRLDKIISQNQELLEETEPEEEQTEEKQNDKRARIKTINE